MAKKLGIIAVVLLCLIAAAQPTAWGSVTMPAKYDPAKAYPLLIDLDDRLLDQYLDAAAADFDKLPAEKRLEAIQKLTQMSSASPEQQMAWLLEQMFPNQALGKELVLARISPDGIPRDYRTAEGFAKMIEGYERKVLAAYSQLTTSRHIDPARVFLTGFSIGGDLSWAIALRNPGKLRGAIVLSSRASYRAASATYSALVSGKARFALAIGGSDEASRIKGTKDAAALLKTQKIPSLYCKTPKATHQPAPLAVFAEALAYVMNWQDSLKSGVCKVP